MRRPSLNHLAAPILAALLSLSSCSLNAQQSISGELQIGTLASVPSSSLTSGNADTLLAEASALPHAPMPLSETSSQSAASSSTDQTQTAPQIEAPTPQPQADESATQTRHIFGIVPNYGTVTVNMHLPPQSPKEKLVTAAQDTFNVYSLVLRGTVASIDLARDSTPEFGTGGVGYSRYLWHTVVDQTIETSFVEFIIPSATHEDIRYYTLGSGGFFKRSGYAIGRVFVTRSDSGKRTFNFSEIVGAGAAAGISNAYYPAPERTFSNTLGQWGLNVGIDGLTFAAREFWPDVSHHLSHRTKPTPATSVNP
jgi:hypothetical protein